MPGPAAAKAKNHPFPQAPFADFRRAVKPGASAGRPFRLAALISHPVQYFSPLFQRLAERPEIDLTVLYCSLQGARAMKDPGFGVSFAWDVPLLKGYRYKELRNCWRWRVDGFFSCANPGAFTELAGGSYDALMAFGWGDLAAWLAFAGAKFAGIPWLIYGDTVSIYQGDSGWLKRQCKRRVLGALFRRTGGFLVSGAFNRRFYEMYGVPPDKCFDAPFAVDADLFARRAAEAGRRRNEIRARLGIPRDSAVFLFAGKLLPRKRPRDLLEALKILQTTAADVSVAFVGEGELRAELEAAISMDRLRGARLLGFRNQTELPEMYAMADALVLPSSWDPKPLVVNEAMACGLPVIVSDRTGVWGPGDIVRNGENGMVYPCGDTSALAAAIHRLAARPELRRRMGRRSFEIVQDFGYERCVNGILSAVKFVVQH